MVEYYKSFKTKEIVYKEDAQEYAMDKLGIKIEPQGKNGEYTQDQIEFMMEFTEWYFSGDWYEVEEDDDNDQDEYELRKQCEAEYKQQEKEYWASQF